MSAGSVTAALDPTAPRPYKQGREFVQRVVLTLNDSYVTGGVAVDLKALSTPGISNPFAWHFFPQFGDTYEYVLGTDRTNGLIKAYTGGTQHTSDGAWAEATLKAEFRYLP
jgi:hypothetical protein